MFKLYYKLTKPGIVYGNAVAAIAGFFLAARGHINIELFIMMLIGICLVIASACVFNNYLDQGIDAKMDRTKKRPLITKQIPGKNALIFGTILGIIGLLILLLHTNVLTGFLAFVGFFFYVVVYGIAKRGTVHGTIVGSISGSIPLVVGYTAVTNRFDLGALLLFIILALWQMPHFYALAMYRADEYKAAGIPVLPVKKGMAETRKQIFWYIIAFLLATPLLTFFRYTGWIYLIVILIVNLFWLYKGLYGLKRKDDKTWGRQMFLFSLKVLLTFCIMIAVGSILP